MLKTCLIDSKNSYRIIGMCFNCLNDLIEEENLDSTVEKLSNYNRCLYKIKCLCSEKPVLGCRFNASKEIFEKHLSKNKDNYIEKIKKVENLTLEVENKYLKTITSNPRDVWLEKQKDLPLNIEEDYQEWLILWQETLPTIDLDSIVKNFKENLLVRENLLVYQNFNI